MKWVRTTNGDKAHAVLHEHDGDTICGISLKHAATIVIPGPDDRCKNCDNEWRRHGRLARPKKKNKHRVEYVPRFKFQD
jgi:hypothetical protein